MAGEDIKVKTLPDGWLQDEAAKYLGELALATAGLTGDLLEIGSWHGRSSVVIGRRVKESEGKLYCIDTWNTGSWDAIAQRLPKDRRKFLWEGAEDPLKQFTSNIKAAALEDVVVPLVGASESFRPTWTMPLRFIFIDGCHYYDFVRDDAKWRTHLVVGGILAFHDYTRFDDVTRAVNDEMDTDNCFEEIGRVQTLKAFRCTGKE
ncbi:hypothetical protein ES703_01278 [subsurface metagenome]